MSVINGISFSMIEKPLLIICQAKSAVKNKHQTILAGKQRKLEGKMEILTNI